MLRSASGRVRALPVDQNHFEGILSAIWRKGGNQARLGLAVSGGVDSMALASLCSKTVMLGRQPPSFTAFIVDHRLREGSDIEAGKVSRILNQMNIDTTILKLDWESITENPYLLGNMESVARRLRFQAIGKACRDLDINSLLVGHHADDQAETVLTRMIGGYTGSGTRGIKQESRIPECQGIYGVSESGVPHSLLPTEPNGAVPPMQIESGGIRVYRPLLDFQKAQLIATCKQNSVQWFEDPTNADKGLTLRNTIRHLLGENRLPHALSRDNMIQTSQRAQDRAEKREEKADALVNNCTIELDTRSGILNLAYPSDIEKQLFASIDPLTSTPEKEATHIAARLIRKILMLASPKSDISLQDLENVTKRMFPFLSEDEDTAPEQNSLSIAGVNILRRTSYIPDKSKGKSVGNHIDGTPRRSRSSASMSTLIDSITPSDTNIPISLYRIVPERVNRRELASRVKTLIESSPKRASSADPTWTEFQLFDGRFWLRLQHRPFNVSPHHAIVVRFFEDKDMERIRKLKDRRSARVLTSLLKHHAPGKGRLTLPVIVERYQVTDRNGKTELKENLCALPTLAWGKAGWRAWNESTDAGPDNVPWMWECRYKMIEFGKGNGHSLKAPLKTTLRSEAPKTLFRYISK